MEEQVLSLLEELCEDLAVQVRIWISISADEGLWIPLGFVEMLVRMEVWLQVTAPTEVTAKRFDTPRRGFGRLTLRN